MPSGRLGLRRVRGVALACAVAGSWSCMPPASGTGAGGSPGASGPAGAGSGSPGAGGGAAESRNALPGGFGSLRLAEVSIDLAVAGLRLRVTPLADDITVLTAPDTWERLAAMRRRVSEPATVFLVAVETEEPGGVEFDPLDVRLVSQGTVRRATSMRALTPGWGAGPLRQQQPQQALYLFPVTVDPNEDWAVQFGSMRSTSWTSRIPRLETERARVRARAGGSQPSSSSNFLIFR